MSTPLVRPSGAAGRRRWSRLGTLAAEQVLISASAYVVSWMFVHKAAVELLPGFYISWLWGWGLFAVLSQLVLTPARVMRADRELPDQVLSAVVLSACLGAAASVTIALTASLLAAGLVESAAGAVGLALAALAFFARRLQMDDRAWGMLPRAVGYLVLAAAGSYALARVDLFTQVTAIAWTSSALMAAAAWGTSGQPRHCVTRAAALLGQVWPQGRWYAAVTVVRTVLYSSGLLTLIRVQRGAKETAIVAAMLVLVAPLTVVGSILPWAHLPELRSVLRDRALFVRTWVRQLMLYLGILGVASIVLSMGWHTWVHLSAADTGLAAAVSSQRPVVLVLVVTAVLSSWTSTALLALDQARLTFWVVCASGALALLSVLLGVSAKVSVTLPYVFTLALGCFVVLGSLRSPGGRSS